MCISCLIVCGMFSLPGHQMPHKIFSDTDWRIRGRGETMVRGSGTRTGHQSWKLEF
jgi:hypothetical protein